MEHTEQMSFYANAGASCAHMARHEDIKFSRIAIYVVAMPIAMWPATLASGDEYIPRNHFAKKSQICQQNHTTPI